MQWHLIFITMIGNSLSAHLNASMKSSDHEDVDDISSLHNVNYNDDLVEIETATSVSSTTALVNKTAGERSATRSSVDSLSPPPDLSDRIPWRAILTHRAAITLFLAYWVFVSGSLIMLTSSINISINV